MSVTTPLLQITITTLHDKLFVRFKANSGRILEVGTDIAVTSLGEYFDTFYTKLDIFRKLVSNDLKIDLGKALNALIHLHALGRKLNFKLFGTKRYKIEDFVKQLHPAWRRYGFNDYSPPSIEIISSAEHMIPFDYFPLFDTNEPGSVSSLDDLTKLVARFPGFSTIIHRIIISSGKIISGNLNKSVLNNLDGLRLRFFKHAELTSVETENKFFDTADWIKLTGIFPTNSLNKKAFVEQLASLLWYASAAAKIAPEESIDHIHHFSCHCNTTDKNTDNYSISLAHATSFIRTLEKDATIGDLEEKFGAFPQRELKQTYPLIFLNACGTSKMNPNGVSSFPVLFLKIGNSGVIGTETPIPDVFAATFSESFYLNLIRGKTVGEAIYQARWNMLKHHNNPLGILYTVYANPDLQVEKHLPEATSNYSTQ